MANPATPLLHNQLLWLPDAPTPLRMGSKAWFAWLQTATTFRYYPAPPLGLLTLRKEKRRHSWYWYAYLKSGPKLHNAYVGRSNSLTPAHLALVAQRLAAKLRSTSLTASTPGGD